ncbi:hypothetical protein TH24_11000 [Thalassospira xiamenensis]|nr:hypothetical protein TH24_11000 [Thalassospira xiamenensis]
MVGKDFCHAGAAGVAQDIVRGAKAKRAGGGVVGRVGQMTGSGAGLPVEISSKWFGFHGVGSFSDWLNSAACCPITIAIRAQAVNLAIDIGAVMRRSVW